MTEITAEQFYVIYGAMTQATGGLIALFGIFIVYKLQIQRDRLRGEREYLKRMLYPGDDYIPLEKILAKARELAATNLSVGDLYEDLDRCVEHYHWAIRYGAIGIGITALIFIWFVLGLFLHGLLPHPLTYFWASLAASIFAIIYLTWFIIQVLGKEGGEYSRHSL